MRNSISAIRRRLHARRTLLAAERLASFVLITWSGLMDTQWYRQQLGWTLPLPKLAATIHYVCRGRTHGLSPHPFFEPEYFDPTTWRTSGVDPFAKYIHNPKNWRKAPHPWLDGADDLAILAAGTGRRRSGVRGNLLKAAPAIPLASGEGSTEPTRQAARQVLARALDVRSEHERLRRALRSTSKYDHGLERSFQARWQRSALPQTALGVPLVSIILPVWNRAERLAAAIASVQAQTLENWELLIVDDGSTDSSAAVASAASAEDERISVLSQSHAGVSKARNLALEHARGRYLAFLDSDNTYVPHFLQTAVAAMAHQRWRVAYAAMQLLAEGNPVRYRATAVASSNALRALLRLRNFIDLNVLVVERSLLVQVGGFDEQLSRSVDYDLVLRLEAAADIHYLPFVAARYDHGDDPSRLTNREPMSWLEVVQNKHLIDWDAQAVGRVAGRVSVVVSTCDDWRLTERCVRSLLTRSGVDDIEIIVVNNASRRAVDVILTAACARDPRVHLVREPVNRYRALAANLGFARSTGEIVVFLGNGVEVQSGWLRPLRQALQDPSALASQPLILHPDGSVRCAGVVFAPRSSLPVHFLAHHPVEDASRVGHCFEVTALSGAALAVRAADFAAVRGFDPIYRHGCDDFDLCLRLRRLRPGRLVVTTQSVVVDGTGDTVDGAEQTVDGGDDLTSREIFNRRWSSSLPRSDEQLWRAAGFAVAHYDVGPMASHTQLAARPIVTRTHGQVTDGPAKGLPALRWAVKIASPFGAAGLSWGDLHFARGLAAALRRLGQEVVIDSWGARNRHSAYLDDVVLVLRGISAVAPQLGRLNLLWVISHPDLIQPQELKAYDAVFAASATWALSTSERLDQPVEPLMQCTDPECFHPQVAEPDTGEPVLFVGNSRNVFRPVVRDAITAGVDVGIYGTRWEQFVDRRLIRGEYYPNEGVAAAYRSAGIVLNDHWDDMRRDGFISNRLFDAAAAGARVVSDDVAGLKSIFGSLVRTYRSVDELRDLLTKPRDEIFPSNADRMRIAEEIRRKHSFDVRARVLLDAATRLW